jgi:hypothetical protein
VVADDLGGYLVRRVGDGGAFVARELRADDHGRVPFLFGEEDADAASTAFWRGVDVVADEAHPPMIPVRRRAPYAE